MTLVDVSDGGFRALASISLPGVEAIPDSALAELAVLELTDVEQASSMARELFGEHPELRMGQRALDRRRQG